MTLMEFSIFPVDKGASVSAYVARCLELIDAAGLDYQLHPMGTVVEGELPELLDLLRRCFAALETDCERITCNVKFDYRRGYGSRLEAKMESLDAKVGKRLRR